MAQRHNLKKQPGTVRVALWSAKHRWLVFSAWFLFTIGLFTSSFFIGGTRFEGATDIPKAYTELESMRAWDLYNGKGATDVSQRFLLVVTHPQLKTTDPAYQSTVNDIISRLSQVTYDENGQKVPSFSQIMNPYLLPPEAGLISPDLSTVRIIGTYIGVEGVAKDKIMATLPVLEKIKNDYRDYGIHPLDNMYANQEIEKMSSSESDNSLLITTPITFLILLVAFGAVIAATVPLIMAISALLGTFGVLAIYSQVVTPVSGYAPQVVVLIGLAVAVDYSLFMITRFRSEKRRGKSKMEAIEIASSTAGRAVFFSGLTVAISLAGLFIINVSIFTSMAVGSISVVLISIVGSLTFLPATLSILDRRINWLRLPVLGRDREEGKGIFGTIAKVVMRYPVLFAVLAAAIMLAMASPLLNLRLGQTDLSTMPSKLDTVKAYELLGSKWPQGAELTLDVVVTQADRAEVKAAMSRFEEAALKINGLHGPAETTLNHNGNVAQISFVLAGSMNDEANRKLVKQVREELLPQYFSNLPGTQALVTGMVANSMDSTTIYTNAMPLVFGFVLGLSFVLLLVAFHSIVIAVKAIIMNLLSTGAAYGALVLVFQDGWFKDLLAFKPTSVIQDWMPVFIFTILFGLSMDYHLFLLTRIKEARDRGLDNDAAVAKGLTVTSGTITSAAAIMVMVFGVFITMQFVVIKELGLGMAVAVLLDATIVRSMLVPSLMRLLGDWNWYMPPFLRWIPRITIEGESEEELPDDDNTPPLLKPEIAA